MDTTDMNHSHINQRLPLLKRSTKSQSKKGEVVCNCFSVILKSDPSQGPQGQSQKWMHDLFMIRVNNYNY